MAPAPRVDVITAAPAAGMGTAVGGAAKRVAGVGAPIYAVETINVEANMALCQAEAIL
jgi:hypothetical protein